MNVIDPKIARGQARKLHTEYEQAGENLSAALSSGLRPLEKRVAKGKRLSIKDVEKATDTILGAMPGFPVIDQQLVIGNKGRSRTFDAVMLFPAGDGGERRFMAGTGRAEMTARRIRAGFRMYPLMIWTHVIARFSNRTGQEVDRFIEGDEIHEAVGLSAIYSLTGDVRNIIVPWGDHIILGETRPSLKFADDFPQEDYMTLLHSSSGYRRDLVKSWPREHAVMTCWRTFLDDDALKEDQTGLRNVMREYCELHKEALSRAVSFLGVDHADATETLPSELLKPIEDMRSVMRSDIWKRAIRQNKEGGL